MKKRIIILAFAGLSGSAAFSQTNPAVQTLPVTFSFGTANFTPPAANMAAWTGDGTRPYATQAAAEASLPGNDVAGTALFNTNPASGGGGGQYGHAVSGNGRLTILESSNATNGTTQTGLAINTTGATSATISYDLVLSVANARDIGIAVQYRVGTSGAFTTIAGSAVTYNSATSNGGDADGTSDYDNYSFPLPAGALNQAVVQIRWITWRPTGAGNGTGIGIDNISIGAAIAPCPEPTAQPTNLVLTPTPFTVNGIFDPAVPGADDYLVIRSTSTSLSQNPQDGISYAAGQVIGNGTVVQFDAINTFSDAGLTPNTLYYYFVFADSSANCGGGPNYLTAVPPLTLSVTTPAVPACATPPAAPTSLVLSPSASSISGSFTAAAGTNRYLVVVSTSSTLSASPVNGTTYTTGQAFGGGTIVSYSTSTNFVAGGLTPLTNYYLFVFSANGDCTGEPFYNTTSLSTNISTTNGFNGAAYYATATGTCQVLKTNLKNIISTGTSAFSYTPGLWNAYYYTDQHRNDANTATIMWDMYSDNPSGAEPYTYTYGTNQCGSYSGEGGCYNREHSFPQSWFNSASPMVSDLHHIYPTDGKVNGERSNFPYGEVTSASWTSQNGGKLGTGNNFGYTGTVFEPINAYKGDLARAQLYMAVRYEDQINGWYSNGNANDVLLSPTDQPVAATRKLQVYDDWYIRLLYKWHLQDPVSQKEIDRNNAVYDTLVNDGGTFKKQGNRNPFVDHPEYVALIWQCTNAIPVTLVDFKSTKNDKQVILQWYATRETSFKEYVIERSTDGLHFTAIGNVAGQNLANYTFTDNQLPDAISVFYRLKMVDIDGSFKYSKIVSERINRISGIFIYPNPANDIVNIQLEKNVSMSAVVYITDMTGRNLITEKLNTGQGKVQLNVSGLPAGRYFIRIISDTKLMNQGFIKN